MGLQPDEPRQAATQGAGAAAPLRRIVILISGRGSNMRSLIEACDREGWPARVVAVISNRPEAAGLQFAQGMGIATSVVDHRTWAQRADFDAALAREVDGWQPDLVVLAGFMRILGEAFVQRYQGRLLNIHPSLLPAFAGLHTHARALQSGCRVAGATVHLVTAELDHGPIVMQAAVPVLEGDDEASLAERVLGAEHLIYARSVRWFVQGELQIEAQRVRHRGGQPQWLWMGPGGEP